MKLIRHTFFQINLRGKEDSALFLPSLFITVFELFATHAPLKCPKDSYKQASPFDSLNMQLQKNQYEELYCFSSEKNLALMRITHHSLCILLSPR